MDGGPEVTEVFALLTQADVELRNGLKVYGFMTLYNILLFYFIYILSDGTICSLMVLDWFFSTALERCMISDLKKIR